MKFTSAYISGYIPLALSASHSLSVKYTKPIQIFIGTNGSGKTSFLMEHSPYPTPKTIYGPVGKKVLTFIHEGHDFHLASDYGDKHKTHTFMRDGEELNLSGTSSVQKELVETHLGYSPLIESIITGTLEVTELTRNERKNLFMACMPIDMSYILSQHKKVATAIRDTNAQLKMLHKRQAEIKDMLIDDAIVEARKVQYKKTNDELQEFLRLSHILEQHIASLQEKLPTTPVVFDISDVDRIKDTYSKIEYKPWIQSSEKLSQLNTERTVVANEIKRLTDDNESIHKKLESYKKLLVDLSDLESSNLEATLNKINKELQSLNLDPNFIPIPASSLESAMKFFTSFRDKMHDIIVAGQEKVIPFTRFDKCASKISRSMQHLGMMECTLGQMKESIRQTYEQLDDYEKQKPPSNCVHAEECELSLNFIRHRGKLARKIKIDDAEYKKVEASYTRRMKAYNKLKTWMTDMQPMMQSLQGLRELMKSYDTAWLSNIIDRSKMTEHLRSNPMRLAQLVGEYIQKSNDYYQRTHLLAEKEKLISKLGLLVDKDRPSKKMIEDIVSELSEVLVQNEAKLRSLGEVSEANFQTTASVKNYLYVKDKIADISERLSKYERYVIVEKSIEYYQHIHKTVKDIISTISYELMVIDKVLKEQLSLRERLEKEIGGLIVQLETQLKALIPCEEAWSPHTGWPNRVVVDRINECIKNVNYFISQVWTYSMKLSSLPKDKPVSFALPLKIKGTTSNDISNCSKSQKDIVNIAWRLALMITLGINKTFPIFLDEPDSGMDARHQEKMLSFISNLVRSGVVDQLFLINHHAPLFSGFVDSEVLCLAEDNVMLPEKYNEHCIIAE